MVMVAGCGSNPGARVRLDLTGSSTVAPLAVEIGRRFEALHPEVRVDVQTGGSSRGIKDARSGAASIGMVSRELADAERDLQGFTIARDGISLITHASNPVAALDRAQVVALYTGAVRDWGAVGGRPGPVTVVSKASGRSTLELFLHHFHLEESALASDLVIGDNEQGIKTVAGLPAAIGYVSIGAAEVAVRDGVPIRLLPLDGVEPSTRSVQEGRFPLSRPLNLVTRGTPTPAARAFLDFARSSAVHDLVEGLYFVPLSAPGSSMARRGPEAP